MFTKIKQTYHSFKTPPRKTTLQDQLNDHRRGLENRYWSEKTHVRPGVTFGIVIPLAVLFTYILTKLISIEGYASLLITGFAVYLIAELKDRIFGIIPFYKLNPFFGNKIDNTLRSLFASRK